MDDNIIVRIKKFNSIIIDKFKMFFLDLRSINKIGVIDFFKKWKAVIVVLAVLVSGGILVCASTIRNNTKSQALNKFNNALEVGDVKELSKVVRVDGKRVASDRLIPLLEYIDAEIAIDQKYLEKNNGILTVECDNKMIGENYFINVDSVSGKIKTSIKDVEVKLNDKTISKDGFVENIVPGVYKLSYKYKTKYGDVTHEEMVKLIKSIDISLNIPVTNITIFSEFKDAKVYINDEYIGKKVEDVENYGPIPTEKGVTVHIEKDFPWGVIASEKVTVENNKLIKIDMNMINEKLEEDFIKYINEFYESVFEALNVKDKNLILDATEDVKTKIYEEIEKKSFIIKNNYEISNLQVKIEKSEVLLKDNNYSANIVSNIKYTVSKKFIFENKTEYEQDFLIGLQFIDGKWIVESIQSFNIQE